MPFYIGVGKTPKVLKRNTLKHIYRRAYEKDWGNSRSNVFWKEISKKTGFDVEILLESENINYIYEKEVEFINLYGKICDNTGCLANIENGGTFGKGKNIYSIAKQQRKIYVYSFEGAFYKSYDSLKDAEKDTGVLLCNICISAKTKTKVFGGYRFFYDYMGHNIQYKKYVKHGGRRVSVFDLNSKKEIEVLETSTLARKKYGLGGSSVHKMNQKPFIKNGFMFSYKD